MLGVEGIDGFGRGLHGIDDLLHLLGDERLARKAGAHGNGKDGALQVLEGAAKLRRATAFEALTGFLQAIQDFVEARLVGLQMLETLRGDGVHLARTLRRGCGGEAALFEQGKGWIDDARAWSVAAGQLLFHGFDELIAVAGLF